MSFMATITDEWHLAAARVSPLIWEVQKSHGWTPEVAKSRLNVLPDLLRLKDYIGILGSEPELESLRDRLVIIPINYPKTKFKQPFLVERERVVEVYDWNAVSVFNGEMAPAQQADFLKWCAGYFIRIVGVRPPTHGP
ncbi:MAG: hypothetical protein HY074_17020 [Deltaproteobacteria bacterium]|nr:hypothetical protein [Deltaproteobacteria bacterium]